MKNNKFIVLIILVLFALFVSGCADPGANQSTEKGTNKGEKQGDETSKGMGNTNSFSARSVSAWFIYKMNKAASNLSWAAAARIAVISQMKYYDPYIVEKAYQGDMSRYYYNREPNAKPYDFFEMRDVIRDALQRYGSGGAHGTNVVPGIADHYANLFWQVLYCGVPIIVVRRDKNNYNDYWAVVIYAMPNANGGQETISVWDPEHGWDYTCDLKGFCDDARFYDGNCGQFAIWPFYGPNGSPLAPGYTPIGTY